MSFKGTNLVVCLIKSIKYDYYKLMNLGKKSSFDNYN